MKKADLRIKPDRLQSTPAVGQQQRISKRKQGIDRVGRWPSLANSERKGRLMLRLDQVAEGSKVGRCGFPLSPSQFVYVLVPIQR